MKGVTRGLAYAASPFGRLLRLGVGKQGCFRGRGCMLLLVIRAGRLPEAVGVGGKADLCNRANC